jgi:hypothetical protein
MGAQRCASFALLVMLGGCGRDVDAAKDNDHPCNLLTSADIKAVTGTEVQSMDRDPTKGAGGTCGNFKTPDGQAYLGINRLTSSVEYKMALGAVPEDVYPIRRSILGLGDEAVLMKDETQRIKYLVARKGNAGVVLFPLGARISDDQLRQLAERALAQR